MPPVTDFRGAAFNATRIDSCGRDVGRRVYWKLYVIENTIRVIVSSVLTIQIGSTWWATAADKRIQQQVQHFKTLYAQAPWHSAPGNHDIYYTGLSDLGEIIRANRNLFLPLMRCRA